MNVKIEESWKKLLSPEFSKEYFKNLTDFVRNEYESGTVYPPGSKIFASFDNCPVDKTKVVIIGQDPYHGPNQANGLSFSVEENAVIPPSLRNIYKEIESDTGIKKQRSGDLMGWTKQGVLLLNATLTVRAHKPGSHQNKGWEEFTDTAIDLLSKNHEEIVFMLWGSYAKKKGEKIDKTKHLVLEAAHPSPLSAHNGFFGCRHFTKANAYLIMHGNKPIKW